MSLFRNPLYLGAAISIALASGCATQTPSSQSNIAAPTAGPTYVQPILPEGASGYDEKPGWATRKFAVAAANPLATEAGYQILKAGGSAIDTAVAVQMVLSLVEPQSSGVGGGAFIVHSNGKAIETYDARETAPAAADEKLFIGADGKPMAFINAVVGGRSVGVLGAVRGLEKAHKEHGRLPWAQLIQPAIELAENGFPVSPRLNTLLVSEHHLRNQVTAANYFYDKAGNPWPVGHVLKNLELAATLRKIAAEGADALHKGDIAQAIVDAVQKHPNNPGKLTMADLAGYTPVKREALCFDYAVSPKNYRICGMPPPSSGTIAVGQILGILANTRASTLKPGVDGLPTVDFLHLYSEASRLAFADRAHYVGDPAFTVAPAGDWKSLLAPSYLAERAKIIGEQSMKRAKPGIPSGARIAYAPMPEQEEYGTSHISVIDSYGNALAMTTTIENGFGSRLFVRGFLLNNQLTDFSFVPTDGEGKNVANRVQPGKRPRSSMTPILVTDKANGQVVLSGGSPGGAPIILYISKTLYGMLNWGLDAQKAINLPNFGSLNGPTLLEKNRFPVATVEALKARGHEVREMSLTSGVHVIERTQTGFFGGADPRREGDVKGD